MELTYRAFGLTIGSELVLPGLPTTDATPEIQVRRGVVPEWNGEATIRYGDRCRIRGQEWSVRFKALPFAGLIRDGNLVQFEADPARDDVSSLHVLGSCTGALLFQRGLAPLHGNTVVGPQGAVTIAGKIGAGKSATTFALLRRGYRLLADDISAVSFESTEPVIKPGFPRLKLWKATLEHFGCDHRAFHRLRPGLDKFHYPVEDLFCPEPRKLNAIYILHPCDSPGVPYSRSVWPGETGCAARAPLQDPISRRRQELAASAWQIVPAGRRGPGESGGTSPRGRHHRSRSGRNRTGSFFQR